MSEWQDAWDRLPTNHLGTVTLARAAGRAYVDAKFASIRRIRPIAAASHRDATVKSKERSDCSLPATSHQPP